MGQILEKKLTMSLIWIILGLSVMALTAESLPEVKAKIIVIPTLLVVIGFTIMEIWKSRRRS